MTTPDDVTHAATNSHEDPTGRPCTCRCGKVPDDEDNTPRAWLVGVFCDHSPCDADEQGDILARTRDEAFAGLRRALNAKGWSCGVAGDFCPTHRPPDATLNPPNPEDTT